MEIQSLQQFINTHPLLFFTLIIWSLAWKGVALWRAADRRERNWFIAILILNIIGLLEIIYLFFVLPGKDKKKIAPTEGGVN